MSIINTNGLPYQIVYVSNIYYLITTNIDETDGLANGADGKLVHVETNEGLVKTIWLARVSSFTSNSGKIKTQKDNLASSLHNNIDDKRLRLMQCFRDS
ncbi:hypothetical protein TNCV_2456271 [Trichonephila clavipes]|nr:hypothetical protein TNCV_2456271 [Trichonephila clavipes]